MYLQVSSNVTAPPHPRNPTSSIAVSAYPRAASFSENNLNAGIVSCERRFIRLSILILRWVAASLTDLQPERICPDGDLDSLR
ncbi:hypothetical protein VTI74DRAFT_660 [Chaetomium olivicolor]